MFTIGTEMITL